MQIPAIYPSTMLKTDLRQVRDATQESLAIVTDGSRGNYLFGSEDSFGSDFDELRWEEENEERIIAAIERGRADIARGAYVVGLEEGIALSDQIRLAKMQEQHGRA